MSVEFHLSTDQTWRCLPRLCAFSVAGPMVWIAWFVVWSSRRVWTF